MDVTTNNFLLYNYRREEVYSDVINLAGNNHPSAFDIVIKYGYMNLVHLYSSGSPSEELKLWYTSVIKYGHVKLDKLFTNHILGMNIQDRLDLIEHIGGGEYALIILLNNNHITKLSSFDNAIKSENLKLFNFVIEHVTLPDMYYKDLFLNYFSKCKQRMIDCFITHNINFSITHPTDLDQAMEEGLKCTPIRTIMYMISHIYYGIFRTTVPSSYFITQSIKYDRIDIIRHLLRYDISLIKDAITSSINYDKPKIIEWILYTGYPNYIYDRIQGNDIETVKYLLQHGVKLDLIKLNNIHIRNQNMLNIIKTVLPR
jgi:hypothetical protein